MTPSESRLLADVASDGTPDGTKPYDGSVTFTGNLQSAPIFVGASLMYSVQFSCSNTGAPGGTVSLECSNDNSRGTASIQPDVNVVNWVPVPNMASQSVAGASSIIFTEPACTYRWVRLIYQATSGTIAPVARMQSKGIAP